MNAQKLLDELKQKVEKLPKEANWFGNVDHIRQFIKELEQVLCQADAASSAEMLPDDDDWQEPEQQCSACCMTGGHMRGCPEDDSPFALLQEP